MLSTLAYRIPREHITALLGTVTAYPLSEDFVTAWSTLPGEQPRYSALATGLVAATGKPVRLFGETTLGGRDTEEGTKALLLTTDNGLDNRLRIAVRAWERHLRSGGVPVLPELIPEPEAARPFTDFFEFRPGHAPHAPAWVFRVAAWQIARALAAHPIAVDTREIRLRMDTVGRVVAWDSHDLVQSPRGNAFSLANVTVQLVTRPGIEDPVLAFDAHLSRLDPQRQWYRNAWVEREEGQAPIPYLPVPARKVRTNGEYANRFDPAIATILADCQLAPLQVPEDEEWPGKFRPKLRSTGFHALGSGLGPRFMARLHEHITACLPLLVPLTYVSDTAIKLPRRITKYSPGGLLPQTIGPTGHKKLTIACLYRTPEARKRMFDELEKLTGIRPVDTVPTVVHERLTVINRYCPALLDHQTINRAAELDAIELPADPEVLVGAWVETEYHPEMEKPQLDAKPHLRRLLAHRGIPAQFLATEPAALPPGAKPQKPGSKEHSARAALRDLLRACGVLDERIRDSVAKKDLTTRLNRRTLLVGISARAQQTRTGPSSFVLVMTAVLADPDHLEHWRVLVYSELRHRWVRAAEGVTDFHAGPIGSLHFGRSGEKATLTRAEVERRLRALVTSDLAGFPVVVFVDAQATRTVWPGLRNPQIGEGELPGDTLRATGADVAVVRTHADMADLGRPVARLDRRNRPHDPRQPAAPGKGVYKLTEAKIPSWLFGGASVTLLAKGGNAGAKYTRWTLPGKDRAELGIPWHSYTGREIVVVRTGRWRSVELAAMAARLCEQPIAWDGRTLTPSPLHLGISMDKDHPDYRLKGEDAY
ncbi:DUF3893 domain-containing protein [Amycolatopsis acidicola]|uniref:DUF3893 domain-containing protein n=1 Tax=Amycolatopsis acidicola TaxID=2596893 RepID=A0A5N0V955_9PSEU|nr:RNaseH domain-containing protein [Amycolatopsis acidicola]KAA9161580.1 DUF3893 domain-containing protein [Amycolatopsis acidicola]